MSVRPVCVIVSVLCLFLSGTGARAQQVVLESAELGTTGRTGGTSITSAHYSGWRFHTDQALAVEQVGGHLLSYSSPEGDIFAALLRLSSLDAFPQGSPFTTEEVVAATTFKPGFPSDEFLTPLTTVLVPGDYALVFGSGRYGATGVGALHNGPDQPDIPPTDISSYIFWSVPGPGQDPTWRTDLAYGLRFVIEAQVADLSADLDNDADVDAADLMIWQREDGSATGLADWQSGFGTGGSTPLSTAAAVPEPSSPALLILGGLLMRRGRGQRT